MIVENPKKHECQPLASKVSATQVGLRAIYMYAQSYAKPSAVLSSECNIFF